MLKKLRYNGPVPFKHKQQYHLHNVYKFLLRCQPFAQKGTRYEQRSKI